MFVGVGASLVRDLLARGQRGADAPAIVFSDELDVPPSGPGYPMRGADADKHVLSDCRTRLVPGAVGVASGAILG